MCDCCEEKSKMHEMFPWSWLKTEEKQSENIILKGVYLV